MVTVEANTPVRPDSSVTAAEGRPVCDIIKWKLLSSQDLSQRKQVPELVLEE